MIFKLGDFKINMEFWTMEIKKMWIKIFQLKRSFISLLNLLFYSHHVMTMRSRRILFMCMIYVYNHRWNGDILFKKEVISDASLKCFFSVLLYLLTYLLRRIFPRYTRFSTLYRDFYYPILSTRFARAHSILNGILRIVATS